MTGKKKRERERFATSDRLKVPLFSKDGGRGHEPKIAGSLYKLRTSLS